MGANAFQYDVKLNLSADTKLAQSQIEVLQKRLKEVSNLQLDFSGVNQLTKEINEASTAAMKLQANLKDALNPDTGNLDFSKFNQSIIKSGDSIEGLAQSLLKAGSGGSQAFVQLADSIARSEVPLMRTNKLINGLWSNLKKTAGWQISSSVIHGVMGQYQQAMGYAKALDKSLNDIRIVTGQSADQMARFAKEANAAAKKLSTTTVDYTDASLIYYQQGLSDAEVKKRSDITIKMANATGTSAAKVSDQLTSIWNNFDNGTKSLEHYADVMTALGAATASSTDEISRGIQKFAAISDTVGLSYEYAASALATITATTRESADTVGNSLKTLFSRIQGLQLGDTLDDGTTLNKYSTALAKVGISIKDSAGALKDMDSILDEMGSKWHTLAADQQMALAQTVGGVRQYTQIMTLMENWDFFKENLNIANTSTGTLTMQAEIYADSWEAAQKRFKASMEGMYDELIDSESFKEILNIGSKIVDSITGAISGMGGLGGLGATVASIFGSVFKTQIASTVSETFYTLEQMIPGQRKKTIAEQDKALDRMIATISDAGATPDLGDSERAALISITGRNYRDRRATQEMRANMSEAAQEVDVEFESKILDLDTRELQLAKQADAGRQLFAEGVEALSESPEIFKKSYDYLSFGPRELEELGISQRNVDLAEAMIMGSDGKNMSLSTLFQSVGNSQVEALMQADEISRKWIDSAGYNYDKPQASSDVKNLFSTLLGISNSEKQKIFDDNIDTGKLSARELALREELNERTRQYEDWYNSTVESGILPTGSSKELFRNVFMEFFDNQRQEIEQGLREGLGLTVEDGAVNAAVDDMIEGARRAKSADVQQQQTQENRRHLIQARDAHREESLKPSASLGLTSAVTGLMSMTGAMSSFEGAFKNFQDGNIGSALWGMGVGAFDFAHSTKEYTEAASQLGAVGKARAEKAKDEAKKYNLLKEQKELEQSLEDTPDYSEEIAKKKKELRELAHGSSGEFTKKNSGELQRLEKKQADFEAGEGKGLNDKETKRLQYLRAKKDLNLDIASMEAGQEETDAKKQRLSDIAGQLNELAEVGGGNRFSGALSKMSGLFETVSQHADEVAVGFQAMQIAMTATAKINDYFYNQNMRNAQDAAATSSELANAYSMSQNNYNTLLAGIDEYNTETARLADNNLKGAEKQAAIFDQNRSAMDLIDKYNITDFSYVGDSIKISENALEEAKEASLQSASTAKYAAGLAKVDAKEAQNDYMEEQLERDLVFDEKGFQTAGVWGAGLTGLAIGTAIGGPIGAAVGAAVGAVVGTAVGGVVALASDTIGEAARNNSYVDEAIKKTRETGSTSWMDKDNVSGFTADELKKLRDSREDIKQMAASDEAAEQMDRAQRESIAKDIINNNDKTENFKYADRLIDGIADNASEWEEAGKNYDAWYVSSAKRIEAAQNLNSEFGLSGPVSWEDDKDNNMMKYTTADGQTGMISYDTLSKMEGTAQGKKETSQYIDQMMEGYEAIKSVAGEEAAAGMLSLMSGGDFETATLKEMEEAQKLLGQFDFGLDASGRMSLDRDGMTQLANSLGLEHNGQYSSLENALTEYASTLGYEDLQSFYETLNNAQDYSSPIQELMERDFTGTKNGNKYEGGAYSKWFNENADIYGSMNQSTVKDFYAQLSHIDSTTGDVQTYLDSLSGVLEGVESDQIGSALSALMALDWSDWNIDDSIVEVMNEFGITIDNTNGSLESMVNIIREAATSIPNLEQEMTSLTQIMGSLANVKVGDSLSSDVIQMLKDQNINIDDYVFSTWDGKNILTKDLETIKKDMQEELTGTYNSYTDRIDAVNNASIFKGLTEAEKNDKLNGFINLSQEDFENQIIQNSEDYNKETESFIAQVIGSERELNLSNDIRRRNELLNQYDGYRVVDGNVVDAMGYGVVGEDLEAYNLAMEEIKQLNESIASQYNGIMETLGAAADPTEIKKMSEQYASTFASYQSAMNDEVIQDMIKNGYLSQDDVLISTAAQYAELTDDIVALNAAISSGNDDLADRIRGEIELGTAMQESIKAYTDATGKKIGVAALEAAKESAKDKLDDEEITKGDQTITRADLYSELELTKLAEEAAIAGEAKKILDSQGSSLISDIENMSSSDAARVKGRESAAQLGKQMQQYLGLTEYDITNITSASDKNPIVEAIEKYGDSIKKAIAGDTAEMAKVRAYLISQSVQGQNLTAKLKIGENGYANAYGDAYAERMAYNKMKNATNSEGEFNQEIFDQGAAEYAAAEGVEWEEYKTAVEMASGGARTALKEGTSLFKNSDGSGYSKRGFEYVEGEGYLIETKPGSGEYVSAEDAGVEGGQFTDEATGAGPIYVGGGGGGGGGGPTKVGVKSAQDLMTRYKTTDQKLMNNEMQKTAALQQKDLLYGQSKINQLNTINTLLRKQQQLTADRIQEEMDYLKKDKARIQEVIDRYNKDAEEEDKISLEFDSQGIITNYKQVVGKWAEELAAMYADGELTAEEGKKAEELQKKIEDFNTIIRDYEDSLQQIADSITQYENTLYEMLSNEVEALAHRVQYQIDIGNDNLAYIDFYTANIKDNIGSVIDYLDTMNEKIDEYVGQMDIYLEGYGNLVEYVETNPLQLWATQGVEGMLTAEQVTTLREYRDGLINSYNSAVALRKEIEDQVLRVFDYWNDKIDKNVSSVSRFTDMLKQFKDIINVVGKDVLGLSDTFMNTFEQQSINQSMDNIEASRAQYEGLVKVYEDAQEKLEAARASSNEKDIEYWEKVVNDTQEAMESAQDSMITTLNHSLTMIAEQFTNAVAQAVEGFNDSLYEFGGLDGLIADYEQIREQQDLMIADYEKIYSLNKLNRNLEKTLDNSKLTAGRAKLLEIQKEINDLNKSNVELSRYDLDYLQAKYDLKVAEMELENARNAKDTVMLSKDSEGNWSYIYSQNANVVEEAEQKVEDALFKMQQLSSQYTEEMSSAMMSISQQMRDEIAALSIHDFESTEAYYEEIERIQAKYSEQLAHREGELNKAISNNAALYNEDWANYSEATGYKMSADEDWVNSFNETILGGLVGSSSDVSDYTSLIADSTNKMNEALGKAASVYFTNADKALKTYGSSLKTFGSTVSSTTNSIVVSSKNATQEVTTMTETLVNKFGEIADKVEEELANWTEEIGNKLEQMLETIKEINGLIAKSASLELPETNEIIGQKEAVSRLQETDFENEIFKNWAYSEDGETAVYKGNDKGWNFTEFNADLVDQINSALQDYANTPTSDAEGRANALEKLNSLIRDYWKFKRIIEKIYDQTINIEEFETPDTGDATSMDTGGYTGEWGSEGKYALLHEKELVLNKGDTANFLEALNVSKGLIEMIEMNARASSFGLGEMHAATLQDSLQNFEQQVHITAEFPDATDHSEIEQAFDNLINMASQYAHRYK